MGAEKTEAPFAKQALALTMRAYWAGILGCPQQSRPFDRIETQPQRFSPFSKAERQRPTGA